MMNILKSIAGAHFPHLSICRRCSKFRIFVIVLILTLTSCWTLFQHTESDQVLMSWYHQWFKPELGLRESHDIALQLMELYRHFEHSFQSKTPPRYPDLVKLKNVAQNLYPVFENPVRPITDRLVCPEIYAGPHSDAGWQTVKCTTSKPFGQLITVILNVLDVPTLDTKSASIQLIRDFQASYPDVNVVVVGSVLTHDLLSTFKGVDPNHVILETAPKDASPYRTGPSWNAAVQRVETPFVFLARDMLRFSNLSSSLERLLRVLSEVPGIGVVGGSVRNFTGHWKTSCYQTELKNYALKYTKGYHVSVNESMLCDYIDGPFITYTKLMKSIPLSATLNSSVIFQDFFLTLTNDWLSALCPDVMFYANAGMTDEVAVFQKSQWLEFATKWELNRILIEFPLKHILHKFSCNDVGISCQRKISSTSYSMSIPVCCQEEMARALRFWVNFTDHYKLDSYFDSGSCLGAVKMSDMMPWDQDGDAGYPEENYTFIKSQLPMFRNNNLTITNFEDPVCCDENRPNGLKRSYYKLWVSGMYIEMWGKWSYPYDTFRYQNQKEAAMDTKMEIHGVWVNGPPNPGFYARKRYGPGCLKHALSWIATGMKSSWELYNAGQFKSCSKPSHHACLQKMPTDGNIAFRIPEW